MLGRRIEGGPYQGLYYPGARLRRRHSRRLGGDRRTAQTRECNDRGRDSGGSTPTHRDLVEFPDPVVNYPHSFFPGGTRRAGHLGVPQLGVPQRRLGWRLLAGLPLPSHSSRPVKPTGSTSVLAANQRGSGSDLRRVQPRLHRRPLSFRSTYGSASRGRQRWWIGHDTPPDEYRIQSEPARGHRATGPTGNPRGVVGSAGQFRHSSSLLYR